MIEDEGAAVVSIAGGTRVIGFLNSASYAAAKGGVIVLTRQIAVDFTQNGIQVNSLLRVYRYRDASVGCV